MREEDQDLQKQIQKSVEREPVPDSLKPEQIEKRLLEQGTYLKKRSRKWVPRVAAAAVALAVFATAAVGGSLRMAKKEERGNRETVVQQTAHKAAQDGVSLKGMHQAKDHEEVRKLFAKNMEKDEGSAFWVSKKSENDMATADERNDVAAEVIMENEVAYDVEAKTEELADGSMRESGTEEYSTTNIQEEGVQEADLMLTDGSYVYRVCADKVVIVRGDKETGAMELVSEVAVGDVDVQEMYLEGNQLILIEWDYMESSTIAAFYDITDRAEPREAGKVKLDGDYADSRLVNGYVYLFTNYYPASYMYKQRKFGVEDRADINAQDGTIPCVEANGETKELEAEEIYIREAEQVSGYMVGVSIALSDPSKTADRFAVLTNCIDFYISQNHIYMQDYDGSNTNIYMFRYDQGTMQAAAVGSVPGYMESSFSLDEYDGYLRVVTTSRKDTPAAMNVYDDSLSLMQDVAWLPSESEQVNNLYVLQAADGALQVVGKLEDLAPGERVYSARLMGNVGYFVTYRQVDPLFCVDLSDPANPTILGELKISGFSEYLHPYGENRLLGIGWETTYYEESGRTTTDGMKLSMFDTSDKANVTEKNRLVDKAVYSMAAEYDHRAILVSPGKNLFGFAVEERYVHYKTYRYDDENGFVLVTDTKFDDSYNPIETRAVYIGDMLFISDGVKMVSVSLADGAVKGELQISKSQELWLED